MRILIPPRRRPLSRCVRGVGIILFRFVFLVLLLFGRAETFQLFFEGALECAFLSLHGTDEPHFAIQRRLALPALEKHEMELAALNTPEEPGVGIGFAHHERNLAAPRFHRATTHEAEAKSPEASADAVRRTLVALGVDTEGLRQHDGSGLSGGNRVSASSFVNLIRRMSDGPLWPECWASLPRAGTRRELGRMYRTAAADNLRAKTGTIDGVSALSGMVRSRDGERLAFSLMVNGSPSQNRAKRVENQIGARLAEFRRSPGRVPAIVAETEAPVSPSTAFNDRHRVARGENLSGIARRYGVTIDEILRVNPRVDRNRIMAGQWLEIPAQGGS